MAHKNNHLVIMAGGVGSRFWPMSTVDKPKQFIDVLGTGRTLLQLTFDRFEGVCDPENVWVVTNKKYAALVHEQLPEISEGNILQEPCRRNTAPCIAYISWRIKEKDPYANIVVSNDIYPDGYVNADDIAVLKKHLLGVGELTPIQKYALTSSEEISPTIINLVRMKRESLK